MYVCMYIYIYIYIIFLFFYFFIFFQRTITAQKDEPNDLVLDQRHPTSLILICLHGKEIKTRKNLVHTIFQSEVSWKDHKMKCY